MTKSPKSEITTISVESISEFIEKSDHTYPDQLFLYRGQAHYRNLLPTIARPNEGKFPIVHEERDYLRSFRLLGAAHPEIASASDIDLLVTAQHHGLHTRLLDWSSNPLVALWFACSKDDRDTYVYRLDTTEMVVFGQDEIEKIDGIYPNPGKGDPKSTFILQPRHSIKRVQAQQGYFTCHRYSVGSKKFVPLEKQNGFHNKIIEFKIPKKFINKIKKSLSNLGINNMTLFPDLDGLCKHIMMDIQ